MMYIIALLASLIFTQAHAQNTTCATRPTGDNSNACASTAFVQNTTTQLRDPITPAFPDTVTAFCTATTTIASQAIILANCFVATQNAGLTKPWSGFTSADVGKLIQVEKVGSNEGRLQTTISSVVDSTHISVVNAPTQSLSAVSVKVFFGSDQTNNIQSAVTLSTITGQSVAIRSGTYLTTATITCLPPASQNNFNFSPEMCPLDRGAEIVAMASMPSVIAYGTIAGDYSGYLRRPQIGGGTIDGNFLAINCIDIPFFEEAVRSLQQTKNCLQHHVRLGSPLSPTVSGGYSDAFNSSSRDDYVVPVSSVSTTNPPVVTTSYPVNFPNGRTVAFIGVSGPAQLTSRFFEISVIDATHFSLNGVDGSAWAAFTSGSVALTMPGMHAPHPVYSISAANPAVVSTDTTVAMSSGQQVFIADTQGLTSGGISCVDGIYTITVINGTSFSLNNTNTTGCSAYSNSGQIVILPTGGMSTIETAIYSDNANDVDVWGFKGSGFRIGVGSSPTTGWNGKIGGHYWSRVEEGEVLAGAYLGGAVKISDFQIDCPARYGVWFKGPSNTIDGIGFNCAGFTYLPNNYASLVRLDSGASAIAVAGVANGASGQNLLYEVSSAVPYIYPTNPNYTRLGLKTVYLSYGQIDVVDQAQGAAQAANNLSDLANIPSARSNLGVTATGVDTTYAFRANNLSDLTNAATARVNLGQVGQIGASTGNATLTAASNNYFMFGTVSNYEPNSGGPQAANALTCKNMYARLNQDPGSGATVVFTLRAGFANTALTCTITGNGSSITTCNDTTHTATIAAGQMYDFNAATSAGIAAFSTASVGISCYN